MYIRSRVILRPGIPDFAPRNCKINTGWVVNLLKSGSRFSDFPNRGHAFQRGHGFLDSDSGSRFSDFRNREDRFQSSIRYLMNHSTIFIKMSDRILLVHMWHIRSGYFFWIIRCDENRLNWDFQNVTFFRGHTFQTFVRGDVFQTFWHPANLS